MMRASGENKNLRVVVVGFGSVGKRHAENLLALGIDDVVICSEWRRLEQVEIGNRSIPTVHSYDAALESRPDAVVLANPTACHATYLQKALKAGCHVYVDKPLAESVAALESIKEDIVATDRIVAVGNQLRFNKGLERAREIVQTGALGRILHVHASMGEYLPNYHPGEDYRQSYAARKDLGGGVLLTQIHEINYLHWLFGRFQSVYAAGGKVSNLEIDVEDSVSFFLTTDQFPISVHLDYLQRQSTRTLIITGEQAAASWNYFANTLNIEGPKWSELLTDGPLVRNDMFLSALSEFVTATRQGGRPRTDFWGGYRDLVVVDAVKKSMVSNQWIQLDYGRNVT